MIVLYSALPEDLSSVKFLRDVSKCGFDGFEISLDYPHYYGSQILVEALRRIKAEGMHTAFHLPWRDLSLASPIEAVRTSSVNEIMKALRTIREVEENPLYLVLHVNTSQTFCGFRHSKCIKAGVKSLKELLPVTSEMGYELLVETTQGKCCGGETELPYILQEVPEIGVCLDVTHLTLSRWKTTGIEMMPRDVMKDQAPILLERVMVAHIHGITKDPIRGAQPHGALTKEFLEDFLEGMNELGISRRVKAITFEVFWKTKTNRRVNKMRRFVRKVKEIGFSKGGKR